jgi:flagellar hook-basal body complex protein FliE
LTFEKNVDIYKSRQDQIETIEKRRTLRKAIKKHEKKKKDSKDNLNIHFYKPYKTKKDFESALNNEIQKAKQQKQIKRKSKRDSSLEVIEEEKD